MLDRVSRPQIPTASYDRPAPDLPVVGSLSGSAIGRNQVVESPMMKLIAVSAVLAIPACSPFPELPSSAELTAPADASRRIGPAPSAPRVAWGGYRVQEPGDWRGVNASQAGN